MNLFNIAIKNLKCNFPFYSLYLLSVSFVLMIFFCFISFANNEVIMEKISSDGRVEAMCRVVAVFIIAFVSFYMSYSNKFFIKRRMKELGIYSLLGYSKTSIFILLAIENSFITFGGFTLGVLLGGFLHKGVVKMIVSIIGLFINTSSIPFINVNAAILTLVFVSFVTIALALSNIGVLAKTSLLDLVGIEKRFDKPIKHRAWLGFMGFLLLILGYALSLDIIRLNNSLWHRIGFSPIALLTMLLVVCGTILCVYSFIPMVFNYIKKTGMLFLKDTTIIVVPKFIQRIRLNSKSMILLILLSAGTLAILGATVLSLWYPIEATKRIIPSAIEFRVESQEQTNNVVTALSQNMGSNAFQTYETTVIRVTAASDRLPQEYAISQDKGRTPSLECISEKDYTGLLNLQGKETQALALKENESILIKYRVNRENDDVGAIYSLNLEDGKTTDIEVIATSLDNPIGFANSVGTLVISDALYERLLAQSHDVFSVFSIDGENLRENEKAYNIVSEIMPHNIYLVSAYQRQAELTYYNSSTFLLISFATVIFLIATGSILYFQNLSSISYDKADYKMLSKMGYGERKLKKIIRLQVRLYFLIPYVIGTLHSIFAILCYKYALVDDVLGNSGVVLLPIGFSVLLFTVIYFVYYQITKLSCYKAALQ